MQIVQIDLCKVFRVRAQASMNSKANWRILSAKPTISETLLHFLEWNPIRNSVQFPRLIKQQLYRRHGLPTQPHETMRPLNFSYSPCWTGTTSSLQLRIMHRVITECGEWYFPWASIASYNGWQMWLRQLTELSANCNISLILFQIRSILRDTSLQLFNVVEEWVKV